MSSMYKSPLYVRYGLKHRVKLLGNYGISKAFQPVRPMLSLLRDTRNAVRLRHPIPRGAHSSVHPSGKPIIHSTQSGLSCPPFPAAMLRRSSSVICPRASRFFNCWKFPVPPQSPAPVVGVGGFPCIPFRPNPRRSHRISLVSETSVYNPPTLGCSCFPFSLFPMFLYSALSELE